MPRPSRVRDAICALVTGSTRHNWSADDVLRSLKQQSVPADFSSVCRGLAFLEQTGVVRRVQLGDGKLHYEAGREHHDHVQCQICGSVDEVPGCAVKAAHHAVEAATGYVITGHSLLFSGVCVTCAEEA